MPHEANRCQACQQPMTAAYQAADPYVKLCLACWGVWQAEAGAPLVRYGKPGTVCTACGMGFGGTTGFDRHRHDGRCLSPAELLAQNHPLKVKDGIWVREPPRNAKISLRGVPRSDFAKWGATHA